MRIKKPKKFKYIPLEDVKKIDREYLDEMEYVKKRLQVLGDEDIIDAFKQTLLLSYDGCVDLLADEREADYVIKKAEIKERARVITPWRRCRLWRLLFRPITNRAQDIIEDRAALYADKRHSEQEAENEQGWNELEELYNTDEPEIKNAPVVEMADEPTTDNAAPIMSVLPPRRARAPRRKRDVNLASERAVEQLPGQMNIADVVNAGKPEQ